MRDSTAAGSLYPEHMESHQVLLICLQPLLSEGLQRIFQSLADVELIQPPSTDLQGVERVLSLGQPDVVVIAGEQEDEQSEHMISMLLNRYEAVPVIWVGLEDSRLHVYSSRILPANSARLLDIIRRIPPGEAQRKIPSNPFGGETHAI